MSERKMAYIVEVAEKREIEGADAIEHIRVNGWWVVAQKSMGYEVGSKVVYCEIDSFIPEDVAPFLTKKKPKEYMGALGNVLKTIRLRGVLSQGLLLPISVLEASVPAEVLSCVGDLQPGMDVGALQPGMDVGALLGICKYELPEVEGKQNLQQAGSWPSFIRKTDQTRLQNCIRDMEHGNYWKVYEITEKLEGQSFTAFIFNGEVGVCSRNVFLKHEGEDSNNNWSNIFNKHNMATLLPEIAEKFGRDFAIQGELVGPGIQGNIYGLTEQILFVYNIIDLRSHKDLSPRDRWTFFNLYLDGTGIRHVPVLGNEVGAVHNLCMPDGSGLLLEEILDCANGESSLAKVRREGLVYKSFDGFSFKVISNEYLEKGWKVE